MVLKMMIVQMWTNPLSQNGHRSMRMTAMVKGFGRRPLARGGARHGEAGVRKPPKEETAFRKRRRRRSHDLWGFEGSQAVGGEVLKPRLIELVPNSGIEWPAYRPCRNPFWPVV